MRSYSKSFTIYMREYFTQEYFNAYIQLYSDSYGEPVVIIDEMMEPRPKYPICCALYRKLQK